MLLSRANSGANGNADTNSVTKPNYNAIRAVFDRKIGKEKANEKNIMLKARRLKIGGRDSRRARRCTHLNHHLQILVENTKRREGIQCAILRCMTTGQHE